MTTNEFIEKVEDGEPYRINFEKKEVRKIYYEKHKEELKEKAKLRYKRRVSKVKGDLYDL